MQKTAVVLFNLGGPDTQESVQPFLFNLFNDRAIINLPQPFRRWIASFISSRRASKAKKIYEHLGGGSPLLANTQAQADKLQEILGEDYQCFIAMRYWHPRAHEAVEKVRKINPKQVILLPLYPQLSTTTTGSSYKEWMEAAPDLPTKLICCYPQLDGFIQAVQGFLVDALLKESGKNARILFSAHGLPEKIIQKGDPYEMQIRDSVSRIIASHDLLKEWDHCICFQSRVGPVKWIGPQTEEEIERAAVDGKDIILVPISFVSEHSETLVELDIEYKELAESLGVKNYIRIPTVSIHQDFIEGLAKLVKFAENQVSPIVSPQGPCEQKFSGCPCVQTSGCQSLT